MIAETAANAVVDVFRDLATGTRFAIRVHFRNRVTYTVGSVMRDVEG